MIRINFVKLPLNYNQKTIENAVCKELRIDKRAIEHFTLNRLSVDARKKTDIKFIATIDVFLKTNESTVLSKAKNINAAKALPYEYNFLVNKEGFGTNPVVVGSGPAGLFAAYILAKGGTNPIVIERGSQVAARVQDVESFWLKGQFNPASNVQFGEGGAGTFSDGKLTAGSKDTRKNLVLQTFAENGAPPEILYTAKPHIGTDYLRKVVVNIRKQTIALGGKFLFNTQLIDVKTKENIVVAAVVKNEESAYKIDTDCIVLAIGHSARDTFEMLNDKKIPIESKAFSIGVRIEHLAKAIDSCQYGTFAGNARLGAASYKLNTHLANGRGVYTFCMCPGGRVVAAQSEENSIVTNGMSNFARRGDNSNSAILVSVSPDDFGDLGPLAGVHFQRKIEKSAYTVSGNYNAPAQKVGDFLKKQTTTEFSNITPSYLPGVAGANIWDFLPEYVCDSIALSLEDFSRKIPEFANPNAVITAPETRSSSPIRILRNPTTMQSIGINGLFPCGEGAGYAGGIISAAIDGIKCAEAILKN